MAPAAKAMARGSKGAAARTPHAPRAPPNGSTAPLSWPQKKARPAGMPSRRNGIDTYGVVKEDNIIKNKRGLRSPHEREMAVQPLTASPSGKFCSAMPMAKERAPAKLAAAAFEASVAAAAAPEASVETAAAALAAAAYRIFAAKAPAAIGASEASV